MKAIHFAVVTVALIACTRESAPAVTVTSAPVAVPDQTQLEMRTSNADGMVDNRISDAIYAGMLNDANLAAAAQEVDVKTENGSVTLSGRVPSASQRTALELKARNTSGVQSVDNQVEVAP